MEIRTLAGCPCSSLPEVAALRGPGRLVTSEKYRPSCPVLLRARGHIDVTDAIQRGGGSAAKPIYEHLPPKKCELSALGVAR